MLNLFCPDLYVESIYELDLHFLKEKNIKGILVDLDNTLLPWNSISIEDKLIYWTQSCLKKGFSLCIISNNKYNRIKGCSKLLGIPAVIGPLKPCKIAFKKGLDILGTQPEETAVIGDQIFTDVFGAKLMGMYAILVKPISSREFFWTRIMRFLERRVLKILENKKLINLR